jgi:hypothetical protein
MRVLYYFARLVCSGTRIKFSSVGVSTAEKLGLVSGYKHCSGRPHCLADAVGKSASLISPTIQDFGDACTSPTGSSR